MSCSVAFSLHYILQCHVQSRTLLLSLNCYIIIICLSISNGRAVEVIWVSPHTRWCILFWLVVFRALAWEMVGKIMSSWQADQIRQHAQTARHCSECMHVHTTMLVACCIDNTNDSCDRIWETQHIHRTCICHNVRFSNSGQKCQSPVFVIFMSKNLSTIVTTYGG